MTQIVRDNPRYTLRSSDPGAFVRFAMLSMLMITQFWSPVASRAESITRTEWIFSQKEDTAGLNTLYVTRDAVKIVNTHLGCHAIAKAPDWNVHCFQPKEKIEWIGKMDLFTGEVMINPYAIPKYRPVCPFKAVAQGTFKGVKYKRYSVRKRELLLASSDIPVSPQAAEFLSRFYGTPYIQAVPLYSCEVLPGRNLRVSPQTPWIDLGMTDDLRSGLRVNLDTQSCKQVAYNAADFELPHNFKRIADLVSVTLSGDKKSQFSEMLDSVGFTSELGTGKPADHTRKQRK
jgi:hypothetical protein